MTSDDTATADATEPAAPTGEVLDSPRFDTLGEGDLPHVDDELAETSLAEVGDDAAQPEEGHPYDPAADPDSEPTGTEQADSRLEAGIVPSEDGAHFDQSETVRSDYDRLREAGRASTAIDPQMPGAAPRAGG